MIYTQTHSTVLSNMLSLKTSSDNDHRSISHILLIPRNYIYKKKEFEYSEMATIIPNANIHLLVANIQAGGIYRNTILYQLWEHMEVMILSKIQRPEIILSNIIYIVQYILGNHKFPKHVLELR